MSTIIMLFLSICFLGMTQEKPYSYDKDTYLLLHFDEGEGDVFYDSEKENKGRIFGATWSGGKFGSALKFNGTDNYAEIICPSETLEEITLEAWIYPFCFHEGQQQIIDGGRCQLLLWNNMLAMNLFIDEKWRVIRFGFLKPREWIHIAGTYKNGTMKLFVNGAEVKSLALDNLNFSNLPQLSRFTIGAHGTEQNFEGFQGLIDEVRISKKVREFSPFSISFIEEKIFSGNAIYPEESTTKSYWIWYPETPIEGIRFFRKMVEIDNDITSASFWITADDSYVLYINGQLCSKTMEGVKNEGWWYIDHYDLKEYLRKGKNIIAVSVRNNSGPAGLICRGEIILSSGGKIEIFSNDSWKVAKNGEAGWTSLDFDDSSWVSAKVIGDAKVPPWSNLLNPYIFMDSKEQALIKEQEEKARQIEKELEKEKKPVVKVEFLKGSPMILVNGRCLPPMCYRTNANPLFNEDSARQFKNFKEAGINIYAVGVPLWGIWKSPKEYDFTLLDSMLRKILTINPESYFFLFLRLDAPSWWINTHKDELVEYSTGPSVSGADQIRRYIAASFASQIWRKETGEVVRKLIRHLEEKPWGKRVIAYQMNYGVYGEWHYYGMAYDMPDTGKAMTERFRVWLRKKYNNDVNSLQESWRDKNVTFENASVPDKDERWKMGCLSLRDPTTDKKVIDYYYCHQDVVAECLLYFDNIVKEETQGRILTGNFYGYFFGNPYPPEGGQCEIEKVLQSPTVDYLSAPYSYDQRARDIGGDGQIRTIIESYRLHKKLHILEADIRTHLWPKDNHKYAYNINDSVALIRREFCNAFIHGAGIWWVDFTYGYWDDKDIMKTIQKTQEIFSNYINTDKSSVSEVAVVCDPENTIYVGYPTCPLSLPYTLISGVIHEVNRTGVPVDTILLTDLKNKELKNYKVYIFLNPFYLTTQKQEIINDLKNKGKTLVFLYAPNFITEEGVSEDALSKMVGMKVKYLREKIEQKIEITNITHPITSQLKKGTFFPGDKRNRVNDGPLFYIDDPSATILGTIKYKDKDLPGLAIKKFKDWTSIYCAIPFISRSILRGIFKYAGVHQYIDTEDIIYVNRSFLSIHTLEGGKKKITLPHPHNIKELFTNNEIGRNLSTFEIEMSPGSTLLFHLE